ncbi:MAG: Fic family protein [Lachnospiraceae bacterium]|nr:Fic family protein [Lachnospiraceae bacterium]
MNDACAHPFTMMEEITNLVIEIGEQIGVVVTYDTLQPNPKLRRESRIKSIHSSLAIEQNTLTLEQVTDVVNGKTVLGPPQDIREVKNAYETYERISALDPYSVKNLLLAHKIMEGLVKETGRFRSGNVGVYAGKQLIHAGSPANYVPDLMKQLFDWMKKSKLHPLIKSCIFHYEFEFIHPFADGNGRTGRLWQSFILQRWKDFFAWMPIETLIYAKQEGYYKALNASNTAGESTIFVTFMLEVIRDALKNVINSQNKRQDVGVNVGTNVGVNVGVNVGTNEEKVLALLRQDSKLTAKTLALTLGLTDRQVERILSKLKADEKKSVMERVRTDIGKYYSRREYNEQF